MIHLQICGVTDFQANPFVDVGSQFFVGFEAILWDFLGICMGILGEGVVFIIGVFQRQKWPFLRHDMASFCRFSFETVQILADMRNHRCPSEKKTAHAKMYEIQLARGGVFGNMDITLIHGPWQSYNGRINLRCILSTPCPPTPRKYG